MVRTDSKEQKLDAFLKPTNQNKPVDKSTNPKQGSISAANHISSSLPNEQRESRESPMEIDGEEKTNIDKNERFVEIDRTTYMIVFCYQKFYYY